MHLGIPLDKWDGYVRDVFWITKPGGWVEFIEGRWDLDSLPDGSAAHTVRSLKDTKSHRSM